MVAERPLPQEQTHLSLNSCSHTQFITEQATSPLRLISSLTNSYIFITKNHAVPSVCQTQYQVRGILSQKGTVSTLTEPRARRETETGK